MGKYSPLVVLLYAYTVNFGASSISLTLLIMKFTIEKNLILHGIKNLGKKRCWGILF